MSALLFFGGAVAAVLGATALAIAILRRPLGEMVAELCGSRARGEFWVTLATLCMLLAAAAASMLPDASLRRPETNTPPLLLNAITQCVCGLAGVLSSLLVVAGALFVFIRRFALFFGIQGEAMSVIYTFALGAVFAFLVSLVTVGVLRPHLARLLEELCGSRARASFWMVVSTLCIFLFGVLAGTVSFGYGGKVALSVQELFFGLITQMRVCLIGLLVSLLTVAWVLLRFTQRFEQGACPPALPDANAGGAAAPLWGGVAMVRWTLAGMLAGVAAIAAMVRESAAHAAHWQP